MSENAQEDAQAKKIVQQLEYYFGDMNLPKDKFMQEQIKADDGWFSLDTMLKFKRLKSIADNAENIVAALKAVKSELVELSEDAAKVRRLPSVPLPESFRDAAQQHKDSAVYAKGFPEDATLDEVQAYLEQFGRTLHIQMRKDVNTKKFKGSVYATYADKEAAEAFLACPAEDDKAKFRGEALAERMWRQEHFDKKKERSKQQRLENSKRRAEIEAKQLEAKAAIDKEKLKSRIVRGSLLRIDGVKEPVDKAALTQLYQELRAELGDAFGRENYLDFYESVLYARFKEENSAAPAWAKICEAKGGSVKFRDVELTGSVPTGDEEERLWGLVMKARQQQYESRGGGRGGFRGGAGGRGGGGRGRGRGGGGRSGGPPSKRGRFSRGGGGDN